MTLNNLCKTCRAVTLSEVQLGAKIVGLQPSCDYGLLMFPDARRCPKHEPHDPYDEARHAPHQP